MPAAACTHTGTAHSLTAGPVPYVSSHMARGADLREAERQGGECIESAASVAADYVTAGVAARESESGEKEREHAKGLKSRTVHRSTHTETNKHTTT